jgi:hypothetical protein
VRAQGRRPRRAVVRFRLPSAGPVTVVLRGPLPACETAATVGIDGRRGANTLRLGRSVAGERLRTGRYLVELRSHTGKTRWRLVEVDERGARTVRRGSAARTAARCSTRTLEARSFLAPASFADARDDGGRRDDTAGGGSPAAAPADDEPTFPREPDATADPPVAEVLSFETVEEAVGSLPSALGVALLVLLVGSLAAIGLYVAHFLRRT